MQKTFHADVASTLTFEWLDSPKVHDNRIDGSVQVSNGTRDVFDLTVVIVAVACLLALYVGLLYIPIPSIGYKYLFPEIMKTDLTSFSILSMGLMPVFTGFFIIEVLSLVLKPFRNWRLNGQEGREKLNQWAWGFSFICALFQACGTNHLILVSFKNIHLLVQFQFPFFFKSLMFYH